MLVKLWLKIRGTNFTFQIGPKVIARFLTNIVVIDGKSKM